MVMIITSTKGVMIAIRRQVDSGASLTTRYQKELAAMMLYLTTRNPVFVKLKVTINFALKKIKFRMES